MPNLLKTHTKKETLLSTSWISLQDLDVPGRVYAMEIVNTTNALQVKGVGGGELVYPQNQEFELVGNHLMMHSTEEISIRGQIGDSIEIEYEV